MDSIGIFKWTQPKDSQLGHALMFILNDIYFPKLTTTFRSIVPEIIPTL